MFLNSLNPQGLYYLSLYGNAVLSVCFLILLPWLVYKAFPAVSWLEPARPLMWFFIGWFWAFGALLVLDFINTLLGHGYRFDIWVKAIAATLLMGLSLLGHIKWPWLNKLYPEEIYANEVRCNMMLIQKMECWDSVIPIARFESRQGRILDANPAAIDLTGYSLVEMLTGGPGFMIHPEDYDNWRQRIAVESTATQELRLLHKDGRTIWIEMYSMLAPYDPTLRMTFVRDTTKYRELLNQQIRKEQRHHMQADRKDAMTQVMRAVSDYGVPSTE